MDRSRIFIALVIATIVGFWILNVMFFTLRNMPDNYDNSNLQLISLIPIGIAIAMLLFAKYGIKNDDKIN